MDSAGYGCSTWVAEVAAGYTCTEAGEFYSMAAEDIADVLEGCPATCDNCGDTPPAYQAGSCDFTCGYCERPEGTTCVAREHIFRSENTFDSIHGLGSCQLELLAGRATCEESFAPGGSQMGMCDATCTVCVPSDDQARLDRCVASIAAAHAELDSNCGASSVAAGELSYIDAASCAAEACTSSITSMGGVVSSEDCAGLELEHIAVQPMVVDYRTAALDCSPCSIQAIELSCNTFTGSTCSEECSAATVQWYEGYARDHWTECVVAMGADNRLHEGALAERHGVMFGPEQLHNLYNACTGDVVAWTPNAERCQLVFQTASDECTANGVDMNSDDRCDAIGCETAVQHVLALHDNCTAHAGDVWPLETQQFNLLSAVSCPCADHDLAIYTNPELHSDVPASFAGLSCSQLVAEHESYCHYDASILSPSLRGMTVLELCCASCPAAYTCTDSDDCAQAFATLAAERERPEGQKQPPSERKNTSQDLSNSLTN